MVIETLYITVNTSTTLTFTGIVTVCDDYIIKLTYTELKRIVYRQII